MRAVAIDPLQRWGEKPHTQISGIRRNGMEWDGSPEGDINYIAPRITRTGFAYELDDTESEQLRLAMRRAGMTEEI